MSQQRRRSLFRWQLFIQEADVEILSNRKILIQQLKLNISKYLFTDTFVVTSFLAITVDYGSDSNALG